MNEIDLRRFDLNLLVVLDVLMVEGSVTLAHALLWSTSRLGYPAIAWLRTRLRPIVTSTFAA